MFRLSGGMGHQLFSFKMNSVPCASQYRAQPLIRNHYHYHIVQMEGVMRLSFAPNMTGQAVPSLSIELKTKERNEFRRGKLS